MRKLTWFLRMMILWVCAALVSAQETIPPSSTQTPATSLEEVEQRLTELMDYHNVKGLQLAFYDDETVFWETTLGFRNEAKQEKVTANTLFRAGSTTKTFIALAINQLISEGHFTTDSLLKNVAPEVKFENAWRETDPVKIIHLLEHSAGFDDMHFKNFYNTQVPNISMLDAVNRDKAAISVRWKPGTKESYSNPGYGILGYIIEKYSGMRFETYLEQYLLTPLKMAQSNLNFAKETESLLSEGYIGNEPVIKRDIYLRSAGNLNSTAADLAKVGIFFLSKGKSADLTLSPKTISQMENPQSTTASRAGLDIGFGQGIYSTTRGNQIWFGHNGGIDGFLTSYGFSKDSKRGYALMINSSSSDLRPFIKVITQFLNKDVSIKKAQDSSVSPNSINGYYRITNDRNQVFAGISFPFSAIKLTAINDSLTISPIFGEKTELKYVGSNQFREKNNYHATAVFSEKDPKNASKVFIYDGQYLEPISALSAWLPILILGASFILLAITLIMIPVWIIKAILKKYSRAQVRARIFNIIAGISIISIVYALFSLSLYSTSQINWQTLTIFVASLLFALSSGAAFWQNLSLRKHENSKLAKSFNISSSVALITLSLYFYIFGYIGLRLWAW